MEFRLGVEYRGDPNVNLAALKESQFRGFQWILHPRLDWAQIAGILNKQRAARERYLSSTNLSRPETQWLDDVNRAAQTLGISEEQLIYEITWLGKRNVGYRAIQKKIDNGNFTALAEHLIADKTLLSVIFRDRRLEQIDIGNRIDRIGEEWFQNCYFSEGRADYILTEKGVEKFRRKLRSIPRDEWGDPIPSRRSSS